MQAKIKEIGFYFFVAALLLLGIYFRVLFFSYGRPFWNDESAMALNLIPRSFGQLFLPMDYWQFSPPLFSCAAKFFSLFVSKYEYAYRIPALLSSILSIPVFFLFCKKFLEKKISLFFALMIFVFNYKLIYYSAELKQYSTDIVIFLLILLSFFYIDFTKIKNYVLVLTGLIFGLSFWFSYSAVFGVFCLGVVYLVKDIKNWKKYCFLFVPCAVSALFLYLFIHNISSSDYLHSFWAKGFIAKNFSNLFDVIQANARFYFLNFSNKFFIYLLFFSGLICVFWKLKEVKYFLLVVPVIFACVLSYLHVYPFYDRVTIYLSSVIFVIMAKCFDVMNLRFKFLNVLVVSTLFFYFGFNQYLLVQSQVIEKRYYVENTPMFLKIAESKMKEGDVLYIASQSYINYRMYKDTVKIKNVLVETMPAFYMDEYKIMFNKLKNGTTYYLLMTHSGDKTTESDNLKEIMKTQKDVLFLTDNSVNVLVRFTKQDIK